MLAIALQSPLWALEEAEAKQVADSYAAMARHYDTVVSAKTIDTIRFAGVVGMVYGTRLVAASRQRKSGKPLPTKPAKPNGHGVSEPDPATMFPEFAPADGMIQ